VPEVRCLRKKLDQLSQDDAARQWSAHLSRQWMQADPDAAGTLYIDGHVRVYHGGKTKLPRKYVSRDRLCLRCINDYWVNDAVGRPFFVVEKTIDPGMLKTLENDIIPRLLHDVPGQPGRFRQGCYVAITGLLTGSTLDISAARRLLQDLFVSVFIYPSICMILSHKYSSLSSPKNFIYLLIVSFTSCT
jgi:hypothetical protein